MIAMQNAVKDVKILNKLGGGNFGEVYRGEWKVEKSEENKLIFERELKLLVKN